MDEVGTRTSRVIGGRYQVLAELGRGGMGIVWRAWDQLIGREVAVKELHLPQGVSESERRVYEERVLREARTAGRLNDPGVVTVYDVLAESAGTYIVMELVRAVTLDQLVAQRGPLPVGTVVDIALQALAALESAHAAGVVHRDVKPGNLMVADSRVKLTDFGIAQGHDDPRLTTTGAIIGSPSFMAPERLQGAEASPATDLWALGATLFFALEGYMPFERQTTAATLHAVLHEHPRPSRPHGVLGPVVAGLLLADPAARFTAAQVRALLQSTSVTSLEPAAAVPATPGRFRRKHWVLASAVAAVVLFGAGVALGRFVLADSGSPALADPVTYGPGGDLADFDTGGNSCGTEALTSVERVTEDQGVSCTSPHRFEVFADDKLFGSVDPDLAYPGADAMIGYANGMCSAHFGSDKIIAVGKSDLRFRAIVPTEGHWDRKRAAIGDDDSDNDRRGSHEIHCVLEHVDGDELQSSAVAS